MATRKATLATGTRTLKVTIPGSTKAGAAKLKLSLRTRPATPRATEARCTSARRSGAPALAAYSPCWCCSRDIVRMLSSRTRRSSNRRRSRARALLDEVFAGELTDDDWEHALGGVHALVWDGDELAGHASVVQRRLLHGGRALRAGYVEGVGVRARARRRGYGGASWRRWDA